MPHRDPRIDAYIDRQAGFARPILEYVRAVVHEACPDIEETIKWGAPSFVYSGGILCGMAAFKQHASFGLWKQALVLGESTADKTPRSGMGSFGKLTSLADLPPRAELIAHLRKAMALNQPGADVALRKARMPRPPPEPPLDLAAALAEHPRAKATFDAFPPSQRREYIQWLDDARREATRHKRLLQAIEWLEQGKPRNWKYMGC